MFPFLLLLSGLIRDLYSQQVFLPVTVPLKVPPPSSESLASSHVSYVITIDGKSYTLLLKQKIFLPYDFRIYTYNEEGFLTSLLPSLKNICFYQGRVADFPKSVVTLSTCSGIRGWLQFENLTYGIERVDSSEGYEHVVYQVRNDNTDVFLYTEKDMNIKSRRLPYGFDTLNSKIDYLSSFSGYLEMHVVVEKNLYDFLGSEVHLVTQKIALLIGHVNTMFSSLKLTIVMSSLEIWIKENKISIDGEPDELLKRFLKWKESYLVLRRHDVAYLLFYKENFKYLGATFQGKICERNYGGGVVMYSRTITLEAFSVIITQLLAHSMGIAYDDVERCPCSRAVCIMNPEAMRSNGVKVFSTCSMVDFKNFISTKKAECLQDQPHLASAYYSHPYCGNNILDHGEECDCGVEEDCTRCCQECKIVNGAMCAQGSCCQDCRYLVKGVECRPRIDPECDVPEYCNGSSGFCQPDLHVLDGADCRSRTAYCYKGRCPDPDDKCKKVFGQDSGHAAYNCYEELNSKTDRSGHCGHMGDFFKQCEWQDLGCGKLICRYNKTTPLRIRYANVIYVNANGHKCATLDYPTTKNSQDRMWVSDGTPCAVHKVCVNMRCEPLHSYAYSCNIGKCHRHGVCNTLGNCHCDDGWRPPDCTTRITGKGGSIDSGIYSRADLLGISPDYRPRKWGIIIGFPLTALFTIMIILAIIYFRQGQKCSLQEPSSDEFADDSHPEGDKDPTKI